MVKRPEPETADTSGLTEADWAALDKLNDALKAGGQEALSAAQEALRRADPACWFRIVRTFYPHLLRKIVGDDDDEGRDGNEDDSEAGSSSASKP